MKLPLLLISALAVAALFACHTMRGPSTAGAPRPVQIDAHSIVLPGNTISTADRQAVNRIFEKYDTALYRIAVYENGQSTRQIGSLEEMEVGPLAQESAAAAKASGLSNWAVKIGNPSHTTHAGNTNHTTKTANVTHTTKTANVTHTTKTANVTHTTKTANISHTTHPSQDSDALVREVTPILEKYSK